MSYADAETFTAASAHLDLDPVDDVEGLLQRASADLDAFLYWPLPPDPIVELDDPPELPDDRIPVEALTRWEARALSRACVAQAAYRLSVGEDEFAEGKPRVISVGGASAVQFARDAPDLIGPATMQALAGAPGLWRYRHGLGDDDEPPAAA